jgi:monofunctional biosynthetic peptidoglycan transglycosylase
LGADAAARAFFAKPAAELSAADAALLAAVLPDPHDLHANDPSPYVRRRQQWILRQMNAIGGERYLRRLSASTPASAAP